MSPSEHDLRAALRDGEDSDPAGVLDVDRIVAAGAATRHRRRARLAAVAATVVVVGAGGTVAGLVFADPGTDSSADSAAGSTMDSAQVDARAGANAAPALPSAAQSRGSGAEPGRSADAAPCPPSVPNRTLPGRSDTGRLFDRPPVTITACSYRASLAPAPGSGLTSVVFTGRDAAALAASLEAASPAPGQASCSAVRAREVRRLLFVGVDAQGRRLPSVGTTLTIPVCDTQVSNGVTVRYGWVPPAGLRTRLYALAPDGSPRTPGSGIIGTPSR